MTTKDAAVYKATLLVKEAYKVLRDGGFDGSEVLMKIQAIVLEVWNAGMFS